MTNEEKATAMIRRNADICAFYCAGNKPKACASHFRLGRQQVTNILKKAGVWRPYVRSDRTKFLGVNVSEGTKAALTQEAREQGVSVSRLVSDRLEAK